MSAFAPAGQEPPLQGWCVGLVRADGARSALARALVRAGAEVLALPALSVRAAPDPGNVRAQLRAHRDAVAWLFVSPAAVRFAWRAWPGFAPHRGARVFAVGPGTRAALSRRGVTAICPPLRHDSEGVLAMPELAAVQGAVALVKAPGGRTLLADGLRARGIEVREVATYRRAPARWDRRHHARLEALLRAQPLALLLVTSGEALAALPALTGAAFDRVLRVPILVSSERLRVLATGLGFRDVRVAASTTPAALVAAATEALRTHTPGARKRSDPALRR